MKQIETFNDLLVYENNYSVKFMNEYISKNNLHGLRIYRPFEDNPILDFSFLLQIENLKELSIFYFDEIDFSFLYELKNLKKISIQTVFSDIDFSKLSHIENLSIQWNKKYIKHIESLINLSSLFVNGYDEKDLNNFKKLDSLKFLSIKNAKCNSLSGVEELQSLEGLFIGGFKNLVNISDLENLKKLKYLFFELCPKIENLDVLKNNRSIEILETIDCKNIKHISFVNSLPKLEQLTILGSTIINDFNLLNIDNIALLSVDFKKYKIIEDKKNHQQRKSFLNLTEKKS